MTHDSHWDLTPTEKIHLLLDKKRAQDSLLRFNSSGHGPHWQAQVAHRENRMTKKIRTVRVSLTDKQRLQRMGDQESNEAARIAKSMQALEVAMNSKKCCKKECLGKVDRTLAFEFRKLYEQEVTADKKSMFLGEFMRKHFAVDGETDRQGFMLGELLLCTTAVFTIFGCSRDKFFRIKTTVVVGGQVVDEKSAFLGLKKLATTNNNSRRSQKALQVIAFLKNQAEYGERMPNKDEIHLRVPDKKCLYEEFLLWNGCSDTVEDPSNEVDVPGSNPEADCDEHSPSDTKRVSYQHFLRTWDEHCPEIKVHRLDNFSHCATCTTLTEQKQKARDGKAKEDCVILVANHKSWYMQEKATYYSNRSKAKEDPSNYASFIIDGADQKMYSVPRFARKSKGDEDGLPFKYKLMGGIAHGRFAVAAAVPVNVESGANMVIEMIHRMIEELDRRCRDSGTPFPARLFVQLDNTCGQNKNNYVMGYLSALVQGGLFSRVEVSFLPVGHTHEDIDQMFAVFRDHLIKRDVLTIDTLLQMLCQTYRSLPLMTFHLREQANWKEFFDSVDFAEPDLEQLIDLTGGSAGPSTAGRRVQAIAMPRLNRLNNITKVQAFRFQMSESGERVEALVKKNMQDKHWISNVEENRRDEEAHSFLPRHVTLEKAFLSMPSSTTTAKNTDSETLNGLHKRIIACHERIGDPTMINSLMDELNFLKEVHTSAFHWNTSLYARLTEPGSIRQASVQADIARVRGKVNFSVLEQARVGKNGVMFAKNSFVALMCNKHDNRPFWIARVTKDVKVDEVEFEISWFETSAKKHPKQGKYFECKNHRQNVEVRSVICSFESLIDNKIPASTLKTIDDRKNLFGELAM